MPDWWLARPFRLPGPTWRLGKILDGDILHGVEPWLWLSIANLFIYLCFFPLLALMWFEYRSRGPRPVYVSRFKAAAGFLMWPLMAVITFFFASMPALHAQWKLASGQGLIYRVAEKGTRHTVGAGRVAEAEAVPAGGGGGGGGA
jgi:hypothetical protein